MVSEFVQNKKRNDAASFFAVFELQGNFEHEFAEQRDEPID